MSVRQFIATKLRIGSAAIEVTDQPHTGCAEFVSRFGVEACTCAASMPAWCRRARSASAIGVKRTMSRRLWLSFGHELL